MVAVFCKQGDVCWNSLYLNVGLSSHNYNTLLCLYVFHRWICLTVLFLSKICISDLEKKWNKGGEKSFRGKGREDPEVAILPLSHTGHVMSACTTFEMTGQDTTPEFYGCIQLGDVSVIHKMWNHGLWCFFPALLMTLSFVLFSFSLST